MSASRTGTGSPSRRGAFLCRTLGVVALGLLLLVASGAVSAAPGTRYGWPPQGNSWTNGVVRCEFPAQNPTVSVSALGQNGTGLSAAPDLIEELSPNASVVAVAPLANANWTAGNASTADLLDVVFSTSAPIWLPTLSGPPLGAVNVSVSYRLSASPGSSLANRSEVDAVWTVSNWSWRGPTDQLALRASLWPTFPNNETLEAGPTSAPALISRAVSTGALREYLSLSGTANASSGGAAPLAVPVTAQLSVSPASASVSVRISSAAGAFRTLEYVVTLGLPVPSIVTSLPLSDYLLVAGAGIAIVLAVAFGSWRVRRRPSDLEFLEEEE